MMTIEIFKTFLKGANHVHYAMKFYYHHEKKPIKDPQDMASCYENLK